ncbi:MAG TPA: chaplin [Streptosporangiaceae bacterium]
MNKSVWLKGSVKAAALTVAFTASGAGVALAGTTSGNNSILGGNQINVPISIPINVCGNAIAVLGQAFGMCEGGASTGSGGSSGGSTTSGNYSVGGGNQITIPISVPINVCGNSAAGLGHANSRCKGGASTGSGGSGGGSTTSGGGSVGGGNQVTVPISVPINVCGNSVAGLGQANSSCKGGSSTGNPPTPPPPPCRHHCPPPPCRHHCPPPPPGHHKPGHHHHHHHGGTGTTTGSNPLPPSGAVASALPTTGANFVGLLALAGGVTIAGAGSVLFAARRRLVRGLSVITRRTARTLAS